jgi:hypothetical protein
MPCIILNAKFFRFEQIVKHLNFMLKTKWGIIEGWGAIWGERDLSFWLPKTNI